MLICQFCIKECKNENSQRNHERLCKNNPDRMFTKFSDPEFQKNKSSNGQNQYTKASRLNLPRPVIKEETKQKLRDRNALRDKEWHKSNGIKISKTIKEKVSKGEWHTSLAKHMHINYNGVDLHGTWEVAYAKYLDFNNIKWIRNKESFDYTFDGQHRKYTPDFYLVDTKDYVEVKGYKTKKDEAKWSQFPNNKKLIVLMESDLKQLNII